jgi:hypothetical protein
MSATSVQFTVAAHIMVALGFRHGEETSSAMLAESVNADPTFVRKSLSKLSKAGLITTRCPSSWLRFPEMPPTRHVRNGGSTLPASAGDGAL